MRARGFTLVEVLVAMAILTVALVSVASLLDVSARVGRTAGRITLASTLAVERLEQLRSLAWGFDADGRPVADTTTDLSGREPSASGTGLAPSPPGTLDGNIPGFVDYLGADGRWLGHDASPPAGTAFIRRWAIVPSAEAPADARILAVVVLPVRGAREPGRGARVAGTRLVTLKVRTMG